VTTSNKLFDEYKKNELIPAFDEIISQFPPQTVVIKEKANALEDARLRNPNIPEREKSFMVGNRASFVKHTRILLHQLDLPKDYTQIQEKYLEFMKHLESFSKHTFKSLQILNHFFEDETTAVKNNIAKLKILYDALDGLSKDKRYVAFNSLLLSIDKLENSKKGKKELKDEIKEQEVIIDTAKKEVKSLKKELDIKRDSDKFKKFLDIKDKKRELDEKLHHIRNTTLTTFSKFERALKKYARVAIDDSYLADQYVNDAFTAISQDNDFKGTTLLKNLRDKIIKGSIDLKNNDKVISDLDVLIESDFIKNTNKELNNINSRLKEIKEEITKMTIEKEIDELTHKISIKEHTTTDHTKQLTGLKEKLNEFSEENIISDIKTNLEKVMKKKIILSKK